MAKKRKYHVTGFFNATEAGELFDTKDTLEDAIKKSVSNFNGLAEATQRLEGNHLKGIFIQDRKSYDQDNLNMNNLIQSYTEMSVMGSDEIGEFLVAQGKRGAMIIKLLDSAPVVLNANFELKETDNNE